MWHGQTINGVILNKFKKSNDVILSNIVVGHMKWVYSYTVVYSDMPNKRNILDKNVPDVLTIFLIVSI